MPSGLTVPVSELVQPLPKTRTAKSGILQVLPHCTICQDSGYIKIYAIRSKKLTQLRNIAALYSTGHIFIYNWQKVKQFLERLEKARGVAFVMPGFWGSWHNQCKRKKESLSCGQAYYVLGPIRGGQWSCLQKCCCELA
jgi:hypothetical protein